MSRKLTNSIQKSLSKIQRNNDIIDKLKKKEQFAVESKRKEVAVTVRETTKFIVDTTKLGSYLKNIVETLLNTGNVEKYDESVNLIIKGLTQLVEDISKSLANNNIEQVNTVVKEENKNIDATKVNEDENLSDDMENEELDDNIKDDLDEDDLDLSDEDDNTEDDNEEEDSDTYFAN